MTLRYSDGHAIDAILLARTERTMRVALRGYDDIVELTEINGNWISDECEVIQVSFAWQMPPVAPVSEEDYICSPELAARLIHMLFAPEEEKEPAQGTAISIARAAAHAGWLV